MKRVIKIRRKEYLQKKFEYYNHMKQLRNQEAKLYIERTKLEIARLESITRRELVVELTEHILSDNIQLDIIKELKEKIIKQIREELKNEDTE